MFFRISFFRTHTTKSLSCTQVCVTTQSTESVERAGRELGTILPDRGRRGQEDIVPYLQGHSHSTMTIRTKTHVHTVCHCVLLVLLLLLLQACCDCCAAVSAASLDVEELDVRHIPHRFSYPNFKDRQHLQLNGAAKRTMDGADCISLTHTHSTLTHDPSLTHDSEVGSFFYRHPIEFFSVPHTSHTDQNGTSHTNTLPLTHTNSFSTAFNFDLSDINTYPSDSHTRTHHTHTSHHRAHAHTPTHSPAHTHTSGVEGIAFVIQAQDEQALGRGNSALGFGGIHTGIAIEFDIIQSTQQHDPNHNHISIHTAVKAPLSAFESHPARVAHMSRELPSLRASHRVQIVYDGTTIKVYLNRFVVPALQASVHMLTGSLSLSL